jgi:hypothetical protein
MLNFLIAFFLKILKMNKIEQEIFLENNPWESYHYCLDNQDTADIKAHEQIVIKTPSVCYLFASHIKKADRQLLSEVVLTCGSLALIRRFYIDVDFDKSKYEALMLFI